MSSDKIDKSNEAWRKQLSPEQYRIMREQGTERAFTGEYWNCKKAGMYVCAACGEPLYDSDTKFDSGSGWPSFYQPVSDKAVESQVDKSHGMTRAEIHCRRCGAHLGHVFPDGPKPTGMRHCVNSASLKLLVKEGKG